MLAIVFLTASLAPAASLSYYPSLRFSDTTLFGSAGRDGGAVDAQGSLDAGWLGRGGCIPGSHSRVSDADPNLTRSG